MASFAEALFALPTSRLRAIAERREIDPRRLTMVTDKRQLVQFMASELQKPPSVARAVLRCNARELRLLQLILALEGRQTVSWRSLLEAAGGSALDEPLSAVLDGLERLGLAIRVCDSVLVPDVVRHQVPTSMADRYTVAGCLQSYDAPSLRHMAERLGTGGATKAENIQAVSRRLLFMDEGLFGKLHFDAEEQAVLDYLIQSGGSATAIEVARETLGSTDDFFRYDWQSRWKMGKSRNAIDRLLARGLIYVVSYGYGFNLYLVIPGDLLRALTGESRAAFWTSPMPEKRMAEPTASVRRHTGIVRDAVALFGYISTQEAARTNTGYIHKSSLKNIGRALSLEDDRYPAFVYALCRQAGLIAPRSEANTYGVTQKGRAWLGLETLDQIRALYEAWRDGDLWGEMFDEPLKRANEYRPKEGVLMVRQAALELVAVDSGEQFVDIGSIAEVMGFRFPLILSQGADIDEDVVASPGTFVRLMVGECLYWLGLVEMGEGAAAQKASPGAASYRLTPEGAFLMGVTGAPLPEEPPRELAFVVQANAEVFVPPYLDSSVLYYLLMITEIPGKAAFANMVSLTRESIRRALDQSISGREIMEFLRTHARTGIPQNVEYLINEVTDKHGHIHIGRAQMYIQVDSPVILRELQARRELKSYFVRTLGDTIAILNAPEPDKLLKELRKAGYLPISDDATKSTGPAFGQRPASPKRAGDKARTPGESSTPDRDNEAVDWGRFADEDGRAWRETHASDLPRSRPHDAVQDKGNIRFLLLDAIRSSTRVQLAYQGPAETAPQVRIVEPHRVMGNFVAAHLPLEAEEVTLNINRISWARATKETFAPP